MNGADTVKNGWMFFQNEILGMRWLNRLIGLGLQQTGLDITSRIGGSLQFFLYDTVKIVVLSFMMAVTTLSLPSIAMLRKAVKPKLLGIFVGICTVGIIIVGYFFNAVQTVLL